MKVGKHLWIRIGLLLVILLSISVASVIFFPSPLDFSMDENRLFHVIVKIRIPENFIAISAGAALGLSGAVMQTVLDNSLASPFTLGISSASAFGASLAIIIESSFGIAWINTSLCAFVFAALSVLILLVISWLVGINKRNLILTGMAVNFFFNSANTLVQYYASPDAVYQIMFWTTGSLTNASVMDSIRLIVVFLICLAISLFFAGDMSIIQQGERNAVMHGIHVSLERGLLLLVCSLLASCSVAIVGIIGFVGLVAPHLCRLMGFASPKVLLISSSVSGSLLLIISDIISKTLMNPTILPIGAVTSLLGIPLLLVLLVLKKGNRR